MIVGYVFSRKDKKVYSVIRAGPSDDVLNEKIYQFFRYYFKQNLKGG